MSKSKQNRTFKAQRNRHRSEDEKKKDAEITVLGGLDAGAKRVLQLIDVDVGRALRRVLKRHLQAVAARALAHVVNGQAATESERDRQEEATETRQ